MARWPSWVPLMRHPRDDAHWRRLAKALDTLGELGERAAQRLEKAERERPARKVKPASEDRENGHD